MLKNRGFTLFECLVALLVLSGLLLLLNGLFQHASKMEKFISGYHAREWEVFVLQLESELEKTSYQKIENNQLWNKTSENKDVRIYQRKDKVIKNSKSGYQPLLTGVKTFECVEKNHSVDFSVLFLDGTKKKGSWVIQ